MKLYSEGKNFKLYNGNMLDMLSEIKPNSIDSIVTDPPYELNFMGKGWDNAGVSFQKSTWEKCYTALKPGGHMLVFGGSRTFHRIACAIEDAGFEIRDTIMWLYGCYSADTQVLTDSGWKYFYDLDRTEKVLQWDKETNKLSWIHPLNYFEYDVDDELCLFENKHISQLVTKNHKLAVSVKPRRRDFEPYSLIEADQIKKSWILNFPLAGNLDGSIHKDDAYLIGWWLTDAWKHKDGKACMFSQSKPKTLARLKGYLDSRGIQYSEYIKKDDNENHNDEHTFYVTGDIADMLLSEYPDRKLSWDVLNWDRVSRLDLLAGLVDGDGSYRDGEYSAVFWSQDTERCDIFQALCVSLNYRAFLCRKHGVVAGVVFNTARNSTQIQKRHRKPNVSYTGKVYCLETETGAFVVRRDGKAFVSGNSGFPKSMNIGLAIDKKNGVESKVVGYADTSMPDFNDAGHKNSRNKIRFTDGESTERKPQPIFEVQNEWKGWGTQLKPSYEPILVCRKPCEGTVVDNVLKYGVGGINIDECRVPLEKNYEYKETIRNKRSDGTVFDNKHTGFRSENNNTASASPDGRFPSNTILTYDETDYDEVCGGMPKSGEGNGGVPYNYAGREYNNRSNSMFNGDRPQSPSNYNDNGSASRYFYCAKASKRDRDEGVQECGLRSNNHPTVKPQSLMQYLIRLITPPHGTVLDPFTGSGSTGKATMYENADRGVGYKFIGIELDEHYCDTATARISYAEGNPIMLESTENHDEESQRNTLFDL